jgi:hypothetical protein
MIRKPTWILLIILALVLTAFFLLKDQPASSTEPTPTAMGSNYLITQEDGALQSLRVSDDQGRVVQIQKDPAGVWIVTLPVQGPADQALASAAETQAGALLIVASLDTPPVLNTVGLIAPRATMDLTFAGNRKHRLEIGDPTSIGSGYYVRLDGDRVHVVSSSGIDALLRLLSAPPYVPTATPIPTVEPTGTVVVDLPTATP